ncbi:MAG TPA: hypothetical protein PKE26_03325 [Kiritimatiellia bacterium]|nr:hypothetical protein [Kiritimatiellia bacterium]HMO98120.1 hypothetical protein [Kiritimatiellia bacterium]HMP96177.1 hypothetical protein [Kiritimatiellia bacterium]
MAFEKFTQTGTRQAPLVSIRRGGSLGLSQGAINRYGFDNDMTHVVLFYDKEDKLVGIKPIAGDSEEHAIKVIVRPYKAAKGKESKTAFFSAKSFLDFYAIPYSETKSYDAKWDEQNAMIVIDLK